MANEPDPHVMQAEAPEPDHVPALHVAHATIDVAAVTADQVPATQDVHEDDP